MLPAEIMRQIRRLEIRTRSAVDELMGGAYRSVFKGRGIEFDEVREYTPDDDVRDIDWNVSARMGMPFVKKYSEERELNVLLMVDISNSTAFGSGGFSKRKSAAEIAAMLAFSAGANNDKVSLLCFSDRIEEYLPPRSGRKAALRLIRDLLALTPTGRGTDIAGALEEAGRLLNKRSVVFVISDFETPQNLVRPWRMLRRRHDTVALRVLDKLEREWPTTLPVELEDSETGTAFSVGGSERALRRLATWNRRALDRVAEECRAGAVDLVDFVAGEDALLPLIRFFGRRVRRSAYR